MEKNETKVICPHCGQEIAIGEHEHLTVGMAIGKDSGLGTVVLPPADGKANPPVNKAEARLEALRAAGIDTTGLFSLKGAAGEGLLVRMNADGAPEAVPDDDPIFRGILIAGSVPERRLFRRWVMAQMFRMISSPNGFTGALHDKGYYYQWKQTLEELRVQSILARKDPENFLMRGRFFNKKTVTLMAEDYLKKLDRAIARLPEKHCRGRAYKRIGGRNIYSMDIPAYIESIQSLVANLKKANSPGELYKRTKTFVENVPLLNTLTHSNDWADAYKGAGAYWTLRNLIMFHGCSLECFLDEEAPDVRRQKSLHKLEDLAAKAAKDRRGYTLLGLLKETIEANGIDIAAERRKWAEQKAERANG